MVDDHAPRAALGSTRPRLPAGISASEDSFTRAPHVDRSASVATVMLGLVVAVRIWNAVVYDLIGQHDVEVHVGYLRDLAAGRLPTTYNAPWYYLLTCVLASPAIAACWL